VTVDEALTYIVLAETDITDLIDKRFTPALALDGKAFPSATYQRISGRHVESLKGSSGLCFARYQINVLATTYKVAAQVCELFRLCLEGYAGTVSGLVINGITCEGDGDLLDASPDLESARLYGRRIDFMVAYNEAQPVFA
jgi:hypothetical protein